LIRDKIRKIRGSFVLCGKLTLKPYSRIFLLLIKLFLKGIGICSENGLLGLKIIFYPYIIN